MPSKNQININVEKDLVETLDKIRQDVEKLLGTKINRTKAQKIAIIKINNQGFATRKQIEEILIGKSVKEVLNKK